MTNLQTRPKLSVPVIILALNIFYTGPANTQVKWIQSTDSDLWKTREAKLFKSHDKPDVSIYLNEKEQVVDVFGACFNEPGWTAISLPGDAGLLAFVNPDKSLIIITGNKVDAGKVLNIKTGKKNLIVSLEPHSFNTFIVN